MPLASQHEHVRGQGPMRSSWPDAGHVTVRYAPPPGAHGALPPSAPAVHHGGVSGAGQPAGAGRAIGDAPSVVRADDATLAVERPDGSPGTVRVGVGSGHLTRPGDALVASRPSGDARMGGERVPGLGEKRGPVQEAGAPLLAEARPDALAALRAALRRGAGRSVEVQCPAEDCKLPLLLVDDTTPRVDGWGRLQEAEQAVYVIEPDYECDPEMGALSDCPCCGSYLAPDIVVLREREVLAA